MADEKSPSRISHRLFATSRSEMKYIMDEAAYYDLGRDFFDTNSYYHRLEIEFLISNRVPQHRMLRK